MDSFLSPISERSLPPTSPVERCLRMVSKVEDMVNTFQTQASPRSTQHRNRRTAKSLEKPPVPIIPVLRKAVDALKQRLAAESREKLNLPNFRRFKQPLAIDSIIGPGSYSIQPSRIREKTEAETEARLEDRFSHKLMVIQAKRKGSANPDISRITIFDFGDKSVQKQQREKGIELNDRIKMVQNVGREIKDYYQEDRRIKLNAKLERIKWLEKKDEIVKVKEGWRHLICAVSIGSALMLKIRNYKVKNIQIVRMNAERILKQFKIICQFIGKVKKALTSRRKKKTFKVKTK
jgi:hypothetical protein